MPGDLAAGDLAHGLAGDAVKRDWPALSVAQLRKVLAGYAGLGAVQRVVWHSRRPFAASGIVQCDFGQVFVKRHDARVRGVADLRAEHGFIGHLRAHGAAVPRVLMADDGGTACIGANGVYEVHALGAGGDAYREAPSWTPVRTMADAREAGLALARLHAAGLGFDAPARTTRLVVAADDVVCAGDLLAAVDAWVARDALLGAALETRDWREDFMRELLPWHDALRPFLPALTPAWVHGDFHVSNLLWRDGGVSAVLDFGMCNRASAAFDVATAIERNAIAWLRLAPGVTDTGCADLACALLEGYSRAALLPDGVVQHLLPLVHVEFALSELAYFHGITGSAENAALAYDGFLLGHAAWFATKHGRRFLDRLA